MVWRPRTKKQTDALKRRLRAMKRGREMASMAREPRGRMPDLPLLRREVVVIDYDSGDPITHTLHLYRTIRVDQYRAVVRKDEREHTPHPLADWLVELARRCRVEEAAAA